MLVLIVILRILTEFSEEVAHNDGHSNIECQNLTHQPPVFVGGILHALILTLGFKVSKLHPNKDQKFIKGETANEIAITKLDLEAAQVDEAYENIECMGNNYGPKYKS